MGRLPAQFAGQEIRTRVPYDLSANLITTSAMTPTVFADAAFLNAVNMPFEVHRVLFRTAGFSSGTILATQPSTELMQSIVNAKIECLTANQPFSKAASPITSFLKGSAEATWEWAEPYYLPNGHQFVVTLDALTYPGGASFNQIRVSCKFQGFLIQIAPASEAR